MKKIKRDSLNSNMSRPESVYLDAYVGIDLIDSELEKANEKVLSEEYKEVRRSLVDRRTHMNLRAASEEEIIETT